MTWLRELFLGNWRNKGVALFFAVTIWYVAYQSEKQEYPMVVRVELVSAEPESTIITSIRTTDPQANGYQEFDGRVHLELSGPRKQIKKIQDEPPAATRVLPLSKDKSVYTFHQENFGFPRDGVEVISIVPDSLQISQEEVVKAVVKNMAERVTLSQIKEGYEVASKEVVPDFVEISGTKSIVSSIEVTANVTLDYNQERFDGKVDILRSHPGDLAPDLVKRTVKLRPSQAHVTVTLRASTDVFPAEAVRVTFRFPPVKIPVKILLDDIVGDSIPVEFYGRKDEISRLREKLREQPSFSLGVRVPAFDRELGAQFTFTEDSLELYGFPGVQIRQHESRRKDKKTAWSYTIVPVKEGEKKE